MWPPGRFAAVIHGGDHGLWSPTGCPGPTHYSEINTPEATNTWEVDEVSKERQRKTQREGGETERREALALTKECDSNAGRDGEKSSRQPSQHLRLGFSSRVTQTFSCCLCHKAEFLKLAFR